MSNTTVTFLTRQGLFHHESNQLYLGSERLQAVFTKSASYRKAANLKASKARETTNNIEFNTAIEWLRTQYTHEMTRQAPTQEQEQDTDRGENVTAPFQAKTHTPDTDLQSFAKSKAIAEKYIHAFQSWIYKHNQERGNLSKTIRLTKVFTFVVLLSDPKLYNSQNIDFFLPPDTKLDILDSAQPIGCEVLTTFTIVASVFDLIRWLAEIAFALDKKRKNEQIALWATGGSAYLVYRGIKFVVGASQAAASSYHFIQLSLDAALNTTSTFLCQIMPIFTIVNQLLTLTKDIMKFTKCFNTLQKKGHQVDGSWDITQHNVREKAIFGVKATLSLLIIGCSVAMLALSFLSLGSSCLVLGIVLLALNIGYAVTASVATGTQPKPKPIELELDWTETLPVATTVKGTSAHTY